MRTAIRARSLLVAATVLLATGCGGAADEPSAAEETDASAAVSATAPESSPTGPPPSLMPQSPTGSSDAATPPLELTANAAVAGRCVPPTPDSLRGLATYAFDGEVTEINDDHVTIKPDRWYLDADDSQTVVVTAPSAALRDLVQGAEFAVGERYVVAANEQGEVLVCGFTAPQTPRSTRLYERAFDR